MAGAVLYERDSVSRLERVSERPRRLRGSQLLWVDVRRGEDVQELADAFDLDQRTVQLLEAAHAKPVFHDYGRYIHITSYAPREDDEVGAVHPSSAWSGRAGW